MAIRSLIFALALSLATVGAASAQTKQIKPKLVFDDLVTSPAAAPKTQVPCSGYAGEMKSACESAIQAAWDHNRWKIAYTQKAYEAHHIYTMFVFALICGLVLLGMWLSYKEFDRAARSARAQPASGRDAAKSEKSQASDAGPKADATPPAPPADEARNTLEVSASGVKVTSPVLGVIVLVVSMGFFYLYLKTVYPIEEAQAAAPVASAPALAQKEAEPTK